MKKWLFLVVCAHVAPALWAGVEADLRQSAKLYEEGKYGQALSNYNEITRKEPQNEEAYLGAGASAYYLKDYQTAAAAFNRASGQEGSRQQDALFNLGNTYYRAGNKERAIESYRQAILKNPQDKEAIHNLQLILQEKQNKQNDNSQNNSNQDKDSPNQGGQNGSQGAGENPSTADQQNGQAPQAQQDKDAANRIMQMARQNEHKKQTKNGQQIEDNSVEKDW